MGTDGHASAAAMQVRNDGQRYGALAQLFHWTIAALVVVMFAVGGYMTDLPLGPDKIEVYNLHKSLGVVILALMALRLIWRFVSPAPPLPAGMPGHERAAAAASHALLYLLILAQPTIGILHSNAANFPVVVFGLFTLPPLAGPSEALKAALETAHFWVAWAILGLVCIHVAAALRHHFLLKDDILRRMLPGGPKGRSQDRSRERAA